MKITDADLKKIISELTGTAPDKIHDNTEFVKDLRMDSLMVVELLAVLSEDYGIAITEQDALKLHTYKSLFDFTQKNG